MQTVIYGAHDLLCLTFLVVEHSTADLIVGFQNCDQDSNSINCAALIRSTNNNFYFCLVAGCGLCQVFVTPLSPTGVKEGNRK